MCACGREEGRQALMKEDAGLTWGIYSAMHVWRIPSWNEQPPRYSTKIKMV